MNKMPKHLKWLVKTDEMLQRSDGIPVETWELQHDLSNSNMLSLWAKHFRNHYCLDAKIDKYRDGTGLTRKEYLLQMVFPDSSVKLGPSIRSGDFTEILVSDFIEYNLGYLVPRFRYDKKTTPNESTKGVDVIGFKMLKKEKSQHDILITFEVKARLTESSSKQNTLDLAIKHSEKDYLRKGYTLNSIKRRLIDEEKHGEAEIVERFQEFTNVPYKEITGAAAVISKTENNNKNLTVADASDHPRKENLKLLVIHGDQLMTLVNELYRRAADEA